MLSILKLTKLTQLVHLISGTVKLTNLLVTLLVVWSFMSKASVGDLFVMILIILPICCSDS